MCPDTAPKSLTSHFSISHTFDAPKLMPFLSSSFSAPIDSALNFSLVLGAPETTDIDSLVWLCETANNYHRASLEFPAGQKALLWIKTFHTASCSPVEHYRIVEKTHPDSLIHVRSNVCRKRMLEDFACVVSHQGNFISKKACGFSGNITQKTDKYLKSEQHKPLAAHAAL